MYAALSNRRGCSQVLFPEIVSPHLLDHFEIATSGGRGVPFGQLADGLLLNRQQSD